MIALHLAFTTCTQTLLNAFPNVQKDIKSVGMNVFQLFFAIQHVVAAVVTFRMMPINVLHVLHRSPLNCLTQP
jgi:hypothetical protein